MEKIMASSQDAFTVNTPSLGKLLQDIKEGKIQLPDFQRGWVWDDYHIRSLLASISLSYPIGAVMLLQTGNENVRFETRLLEGVELDIATKPKPDYLILDGQQRLTALFLSLFSGKFVQTRTDKGNDIDRYYYIDIKKALNPVLDREDAIISIPREKRTTTDFGRNIDLDISDRQKEFDKLLFPVSSVFIEDGWGIDYIRQNSANRDNIETYVDFEKRVIQNIKSYEIPTIELIKETPKEAVCLVFEKVNTGGVSLTVFELVTAFFAADNFNLREDWNKREKIIHEDKYEVLDDFDNSMYLMAITLYTTYLQSKIDSNKGVSCKRKDILELQLQDYLKCADQIEQGLLSAARFLAREGVFGKRVLPYTTQLVPLSVICAILKDRINNDQIRRKLSQWYWCGVFGELYGSAIESRFAFDLPEVINWIDGSDSLPRTIRDSSFAPLRLLSLQSRLSAAYKGLTALEMRAGCLDFLSGDPITNEAYYDLSIDIHHIFPREYSEPLFDKYHWNSCVNKAPLSASSNRIIGGKAPSVYLEKIQRVHNISSDRLTAILFTHFISYTDLIKDDFQTFIRKRAYKLLLLIENATGKETTGKDSDEIISAFKGPFIE
jgi:hypothetical protein